MILLSHPTGNNFSRALLTELLQGGLLGEFVTAIAVPGDNWAMRFASTRMRSVLLRRSFDLPQECIRTHPFREIGRLAAMAFGAKWLTRQETGFFSCDAVYHETDRFVARQLDKIVKARGVSAVYAYEDGALETFRAARTLNLRRIYDLPIAYWETSRQLMEQERERLPEWKITMEAIHDSTRKTARKTEELELANAVVCPSRFVYDSLPEQIRATHHCIVAPFGSPPARPDANRRPANPGAPLRVLFAGSMSQRKGLADVFAAMRLLRSNDVELVVFGSPIAPMSFYRDQLPQFTYEPPRSNEDVLRLMETCDVLVLPSIVEGRALVQQEALCCGLPLIVTRNAGGEDLIDEGRTGWLIPIRSPELIAAKIDWCASHREELEAMRPLARAAAAKLSWKSYASGIISSAVKGVSPQPVRQ